MSFNIYFFQNKKLYLGSDVSLHNPIWVETYVFEYLHQEASLWVHMELNMWVMLKERNVWSEAGQLLHRRMEETWAPELSNCQHLITHKECTTKVSHLSIHFAFMNSEVHFTVVIRCNYIGEKFT